MLPWKGVFMAVDFAYYRDIYGGKGDESEISPLLASAERVVRGCVVDVSEADEAFRTAVCVQADFLDRAEDCGGYSSVKIGSFSVSGGSRGDRFSAPLCGEAEAVLDSAGLFYRGMEA